jgi:two-component system, response regulator RpfG
MHPALLRRVALAQASSVTDIATARHQRNTVVIVDDLITSRLLVAEMVRRVDDRLNLVTFGTPAEALAFAAENAIDLVLTDYNMPEFDGVELTRRLRALPHCADVPIIVITVYEDRQIRYAALEAGASDYLTKPIDEHEAMARCANLLQLRRQKLALSDHARLLQNRVAQAVEEIHARELETLLVLAKAGEYRDKCTANHLARMSKYSALIGTRAGMSEEAVHELEVAAPMHDIGKIGIPDAILLKEGPLEGAEMKLMRTHAQIGHDILQGSPSKYLRLGAVIALGHHERYDGGGYPAGLEGEDIPLPARIVAVADVFDALTTSRPYKRAWPVDKALDYLRSQRGRHFDPQCVDGFFDAMPEVRQVVARLHDDR